LANITASAAQSTAAPSCILDGKKKANPNAAAEPINATVMLIGPLSGCFFVGANNANILDQAR
jgi:hypothetical protein